MIGLMIFLFCVAVALGTGVLAGASDYRGLTIPNMYSAIIAGTFVPAAAAAWLSDAAVFGPMKWHIGAFAVVLAVTMAMFFAKLIGGGDSKLLSAYALWTGFAGLVPLLFYMALAGGVLGFAAIVIKNRKPFANPKEGSWIAKLQAGEGRVPYGIPIVIGAFIAFLQLGYFGMESMNMFLRGGES